MSDLQEAYGKGYYEGERSVLRMLKSVLDDAPKSGYTGSTKYYKHSIEIILEVFEYGKEEKEEN